MGQPKKDRAWQTVDGGGGTYILKPHRLIKHDAYRTASLRAKAILDAIQLSFNGYNNGRIGVCMDEIAARIGSANHTANRLALAELIDRGILALERSFPVGSRMANEYRITFIGTGAKKAPITPTNDFLRWKVGDPGTVKKRAQPAKLGNKRPSTIATRKASSVAVIDDDGKRSVSVIATLDGQNPQSSVSVIATHIGYHGYAPADPVLDGRKNGARPDCIPDDRWRAAAKLAADNPAGPPAEELRERVARYLKRNGRGSQTRLANAAAIPGGTLSKFIRGSIDLDNAARVRIACAIPRIDPLAATGVAA